MKKIILLSLLGIIFLTETSFAEVTKSAAFAPTGIWIKLLVNFHRPKLDCQSGFGLCFAVSWGLEDNIDGYTEKNLCLVRGKLNERNQLVFEIDEVALNNYEDGAALSNFKAKSSISILDAYTLPDATCRALGSSRQFTIKPGNYPVSYENGVYTIVF
ncbi:MAG: hypothetical protein WCK84_07730 [Bacteroidota bacterium]